MKKNYIFKFLLFAIPVSAFILMSSSGGRSDGRSGSPGDGGTTCASCHGGGNFNLSPSITTNIPTEGYTPGATYTINVNSTSSSSKLGIQLTAENGEDTKIGSFVAGTGSRVSGQRITHSSPSSSGDWSFTWTAPATNQGDVTFYAAVNATDNSFDTSGDQVVTANTSANVLSTSNAQFLDFDLFPNPAISLVTVQLPSGSANGTVQVYNYVGKLVQSENISSLSNKINIQNLSAGVYMVKVLSEGKIGTQKFIKQ